MTCKHLIDLEQALINQGFKETSRGKVWSLNVREWVYFRVCFDMLVVRNQYRLDPCVVDHMHLGTHDGQEAGFEVIDSVGAPGCTHAAGLALSKEATVSNVRAATWRSRTRQGKDAHSAQGSEEHPSRARLYPGYLQ